MRLAVFTDIHGNKVAFDAMLDDMAQAEKEAPFDMIWCLGDLAAFGAQAAACIHQIRTMQERYGQDVFKCIGGNTDRYLTTGVRMPTPPAKDEAGMQRRIAAFMGRDQVLNWNLSQLSWDDYEYLKNIAYRELWQVVDGFGIVIGVHGIPGDDEGNQLQPDSPDEEAYDALLDREGNLFLAGHTHRQMNRQVKDRQVVNPGSVGLSFTQPGHAEWAILTFADGVVNVDLRAVAYDVEAAIEAVKASDHPNPAWVIGQLKSAT